MKNETKTEQTVETRIDDVITKKLTSKKKNELIEMLADKIKFNVKLREDIKQLSVKVEQLEADVKEKDERNINLQEENQLLKENNELLMNENLQLSNKLNEKNLFVEMITKKYHKMKMIDSIVIVILSLLSVLLLIHIF